LSVMISNNEGESVEAHLVSAVATSIRNRDGSSSINIRMGWFWILDRLRYANVPRRQRLLMHSRLPQTAESFQMDEKYDIMKELDRMGVFDDDFTGKDSLADLTITKSHRLTESLGIRSSVVSAVLRDEPSVTVVDAKFRSLFIQW